VQVLDSKLIPKTETNETVLKEQNILTETDGIVFSKEWREAMKVEMDALEKNEN